MPKNSYLDKKNRLDRLTGLLKGEEHWITSDLCQKLNISHRTLMRDLTVLQEMGVQLESSVGRGGGVRINGRSGLSKLELTYKEIIDLILALATIERLKSPIFLQDMSSIKEKISNAFPPEQRERISNLRKRIYIGDTASTDVLKTYTLSSTVHLDTIHDAFFNQFHMQITYKSKKLETIKRTIEPHYLVLNWPVWYILAWDHLRNDIRFFRIDRILQSQVMKENFPLHHRIRFKKELEAFYETI